MILETVFQEVVEMLVQDYRGFPNIHRRSLLEDLCQNYIHSKFRMSLDGRLSARTLLSQYFLVFPKTRS